MRMFRCNKDRPVRPKIECVRSIDYVRTYVGMYVRTYGMAGN